jgi:hypothetical protein
MVVQKGLKLHRLNCLKKLHSIHALYDHLCTFPAQKGTASGNAMIEMDKVPRQS